MKTPLDTPSLRNKVISLLARREYSRAELYQRFKDQVESTQLLNEELDRLAENGYQSDQRFAESFVRQRVSQYWGQKRITYELQQKGIPKDLILRILEEMEVNWADLAKELAIKRFNQSVPTSQKEQSRRFRYLLNHGFDYEEAKNALKPEFE